MFRDSNKMIKISDELRKDDTLTYKMILHRNIMIMKVKANELFVKVYNETQDEEQALKKANDYIQLNILNSNYFDETVQCNTNIKVHFKKN